MEADATLSKLRIYSLGIVAKNKPLDTYDIEVTPVEDINMANGEITDHGVEQQSKGKDANGGSYETKVQSSNTVIAKWMPVGSPNQYTAPDVRRGERVAIYQFGDSDQYFWVTMQQDLRLRKLETVIYAFSGTQKENDGVSADTHYFLEVSTHKKLVHFHTSKANGEPFAYDLQFNTEKGYFIVQDDIGNIITLDSKERRIEFINTDGTHQDMDKRNFTVTVPDNTTINTGKNTHITTGADTTVETTGNTLVTSGGNTTIDSQGATTVTSGGSISIMSRGGNTSMEGAGSMDVKMASIEIDAPVTFKQPIQCAKIATGAEIDCPSISGLASGLK